jgi:hypothetical protein
MSRYDDTVGGKVEAAISLMIGGIAEERTQGAGSKFVRSCGGEVGIACAPDGAHIVVAGESI